MKYIIEHLQDKLYEWCLIEYKHISKIIGKNNLIFTNIKNPKERNKLKKLGEVKKESVTKLKLKNSLLLDPQAKKTLKPSDSKFDYLIFGGILGDYPPQKRTNKLLTSKLNIETRNLTKKQMSTDTAVIVSNKIIKGTPISKIKFIENPTITLKKGKFQEEIQLPYKYILKNNKPLISKELITYLKNKEDI